MEIKKFLYRSDKFFIMAGTDDILLDHIEATHEFFIEILVHFLTEFVTSLNESDISHIEIVFEVINQNVEFWCCGVTKHFC